MTSIDTESPLVSVVLAVYNGENYLAESVAGALAQTYSQIEILIVDDGSTDRTAEIGRRFESDSAGRVRCLTREHQGLPHARNEGIRQASGDFIALLDHDDVWYPDKIARQVRLLLENPELAFVFSDYDIINPAGQTIARRAARKFMKRGRVFPDLFDANFISSSTLVYRRSALDRAGHFDVSFHYALDWQLSLRLAASAPIDFVDESLAAWRWRPDYERSHREIYLKELSAVVEDIGRRFAESLPPDRLAAVPARLARISAALSRHYAQSEDAGLSIQPEGAYAGR